MTISSFRIAAALSLVMFLTLGGCASVGSVNMTHRETIDRTQVATIRICNLGAAVESIDGKRILGLSSSLITNVAYVEPGSHTVVVSGHFADIDVYVANTSKRLPPLIDRVYSTIDVPTRAGMLYTFHYEIVGNTAIHSFKERLGDYSTSCDAQAKSKDD